MQRLLVIVLLVLCIATGSAAHVSAAPHADSVPQTRLDRLSKVTNVTLWFRYPEEETEDHFLNYLSDADMELIHNLGLKSVRLAMSPQYIYKRGIATPDAKMLDYYDKAVKRFIDHDIAVIVDVHNEDPENFEKDQVYRDGYIKFWALLAKHFSTFDPEMVFIETFSEPVFWDTLDVWKAYQQHLIETIRSAAPEHTIIATGAHWGSLDGLLLLGEPYSDKNVVYSFHYYEPFTFTHQGATWADLGLLKRIPYPVTPARCDEALKKTFDANLKTMVQDYCAEGWNVDKIDAQIKKAADWAELNSVHLFISEFGVYCPTVIPTDRLQWFADFVTVTQKYNIGWAVWSYEECFGLSRKVENDKIDIDEGVAKALGLTVPAP